MPYTLWSRGRLLGESELDYKRVVHRHRMGDFYPTNIGAKLMPVATGASAAGMDLAKLTPSSPVDSDKGEPPIGLLELRQTAEYADFAAAQNRCDALALELHGPHGSMIPTEWIDVRDTEFLLSLACHDDLDMDDADRVFSDDADRVFSDDADAELFGDAHVDYGSEDAFPRYQLQVMLRDDAAVP
jgi:hypothetical protein